MAELDKLAAKDRGQVRITALRAVQMRNTPQTLVKVETDAGIVGIGEAGGPGPMVRAHLKHMEPVLLGQDPLDVERLYDTMMGLQHPNRPHVPTVSGVDCALWDIAGKILNRPVSQLLRGQYRSEIPLYVNWNGPDDWLDKGAVREWAAQVQAHPSGWKAVKVCFHPLYENALKRTPRQVARRSPMFFPSEIALIAAGYENLREALDPSIDIIVHCHNEFDLAGMTGLARALAPLHPAWIEDPLPAPYSESWKTLKLASPVPILTGEKLEGPREFLPFMVNGAVDMLQPDVLFAGGLTGTWRIAEMADLFYIPINTHNIGSVVHNAITAHFAAATSNFCVSETGLGMFDVHEELIEEKLVVQDARLRVPEGPGLGITLIEDAVKAGRMEGEPYWA